MRLTSSQLDDVQLAIDLDKAQYLVVSSSAYSSEELELIGETRTRCLIEKVLVEELRRRQLDGDSGTCASIDDLSLTEESFELLAADIAAEERWAACTLFRAYRQVVATRKSLGFEAVDAAADNLIEPWPDDAHAAASHLRLIAGGRAREAELQPQQANQSIK